MKLKRSNYSVIERKTRICFKFRSAVIAVQFYLCFKKDLEIKVTENFLYHHSFFRDNLTEIFHEVQQKVRAVLLPHIALIETSSQHYLQFATTSSIDVKTKQDNLNTCVKYSKHILAELIKFVNEGLTDSRFVELICRF